MKLNNQTVDKINEMLNSSFKNIEVKDLKILENYPFKDLKLTFDIKRINNDFHINLDLNRIFNIEEMMYVIKQHLANEILRTYGLI